MKLDATDESAYKAWKGLADVCEFQLTTYDLPSSQAGAPAKLVVRKCQINSYRLLDKGAKLSYASCLQKLNIHLLLERVFLNAPGYSLTNTQLQANATERLRKFRNRSHFSRDAKRIYEKTYYSRASHQKVHGLNSTSASRLSLSRIGQPGSISAFLLVAWQHDKKLSENNAIDHTSKASVTSIHYVEKSKVQQKNVKAVFDLRTLKGQVSIPLSYLDKR
ncbi:hypothetical protein T265_07393 [Opisthorchis viverrini]|uniref:Uncharacterized protein n=1 Tax=Opisthorchis viverrini TaxID=6198 RepID=A0A074ZCV3_OPIVI|nr:hypothetical protein T265_07393 [Opisthorchis viverrini]KER25106.1 hypothetical protein T265_07393 [Opisthorchis viverrini]